MGALSCAQWGYTQNVCFGRTARAKGMTLRASMRAKRFVGPNFQKCCTRDVVAVCFYLTFVTYGVARIRIRI